MQRNVNRCPRIRSACSPSPSFDLNSGTVSIQGPRAGSSRISSSASALPRHTPSPPPGVVGTDAVRQRQGPQQLSTVRCPSRLWFRRHRRSARSGSGRNQDQESRQGCRITVVIALSRPHPAALNNRLLRTRRRWRGSPGPARPDRWRQESTRIGSTAAPTHPKPRAILKDRNHFGLLPLQSFMAGEPRQAAAIPTARASLALLAVRLGLIRTGVISTRQWRSADRPAPVDLGRSADQQPRVRRRRSISGK